jgi:SAM-dependent methyltransferase
MSSNHTVQVPKSHYYNGYDGIDRFISYFYQVDLTKALQPQSILEVGVGNKTVTNYLRQHGLPITTCDLDASLEPDQVADIRALPVERESFDAVLAFEVLEHIPWDQVETALTELRRVTRKYVLLSVPYSSAVFELVVHFPLIQRLLKKPFVNVCFLRLPYFFRRIRFDGEHYWEMGRKGYSRKSFRKLLQGRFRIVREVRPILDSIHLFFVLEKR